MGSGGIEHLEPILLLLLVFVVGLAALAKRLQTPYPIVLVIGGLVLSFFPHVPRIQLSPDLIFLVILPPLLFSAAAVTSWRDFRYNLVSISMLAVGLVGFTVWGVAAATRWLLPGFTWQLGLVLGAVVCTTDAIAATAISRRLGLPQRLVTIIEGESMVNDASGLLALQFATARIMTGHVPAPGERFVTFFYLVASGIVIGLLLGKLVRFAAQRIDDAPIEIKPADFDAFERILGEVQTAYGAEDLGALRARVTPEMLSYYSEELAKNASRGLVNQLSNVKLLQGDLAEGWRESDDDYATVAMRYSLTDRTLERASGRVVEGDDRAQEATELWTFRRTGGGNWLLSAVQQTQA